MNRPFLFVYQDYKIKLAHASFFVFQNFYERKSLAYNVFSLSWSLKVKDFFQKDI